MLRPNLNLGTISETSRLVFVFVFIFRRVGALSVWVGALVRMSVSRRPLPFHRIPSQTLWVGAGDGSGDGIVVGGIVGGSSVASNI